MVVSLFQGPGEEPKYKVELLPAEGAVSVSDGSVNVLVGLTSAVMREPAGECARPRAGRATTGSLANRPTVSLCSGTRHLTLATHMIIQYFITFVTL